RLVRPRLSPTRSFETCGTTGSTTSRPSSWAGDPFSGISGRGAKRRSSRASRRGSSTTDATSTASTRSASRIGSRPPTASARGWGNWRIPSGELGAILTKLKRERRGGNTKLEGGPAVVRECLRRNLADDYWFFVMPVVYGKGPRYWGPMDGQTTLSLIETKPGKNKEILLHYEAVR